MRLPDWLLLELGYPHKREAMFDPVALEQIPSAVYDSDRLPPGRIPAVCGKVLIGAAASQTDQDRGPVGATRGGHHQGGLS
ncbi:hypothetical protein GCM10022248_90150 [Nonomuraea soli]